jgi:hypothetical protein
MDFKKMAFGFSSVAAGQKKSVVNAEPQLIVNSTPGKFTITSPVSKAMGLAAGEYVQFVNNIRQIEDAIRNKDEQVMAVAAELGVDITTREGQMAVVDTLTQWGIIKGQPIFDDKGNPVLSTIRMTSEEKRAYIEAHAAEILEVNREALIERVGNPDATDEELIAAVDIDEIEYPKTQAYTGSKTATTSKGTGVGLQLGFTDSSVWATLKQDLKDEASKKNRIYKVDIENAAKVSVDDKEIVIYPISFVEDTDPVVRIKNTDESNEAAAE